MRTERMPGENEDKDWSVASISQGVPQSACKPSVAGSEAWTTFFFPAVDFGKG